MRKVYFSDSFWILFYFILFFFFLPAISPIHLFVLSSIHQLIHFFVQSFIHVSI